jgi:hypothetical protein
MPYHNDSYRNEDITQKFEEFRRMYPATTVNERVIHNLLESMSYKIKILEEEVEKLMRGK